MHLSLAPVFLIALTEAASLSNFVAPVAFLAGSCHFDNDTCAYHHDNTGQFQWQMGSGATPSYFTGPTHDHSTDPSRERHGGYMFIESSNPRLNGDRARFVSEWLQPNSGGNTCVGFQYSMYGHTMGTVRVYIKHVEMDKPELLWQLQGNQGTGWHEAKVSVMANHPFKIIFEGETSYSYLGDAAIDDVRVFADPGCFLWPPQAMPMLPVTPPLIPSLPGSDACGVRPASGRILGGSTAAPGSWPWQAMILNTRNASNIIIECSASLVSSEWVVTSAHCVATFLDISDYAVRLGAYRRNVVDTNQQDIDIRHIYIHPDFNTITKFNLDVAMIRLARPAVLSDGVAPVCLPSAMPQVPAGTQCWVTGWGALWDSGPRPGALMQARLPVVSNQECGHMESYPGRITSNMLCAGLKYGAIDTCDGDSGGPLVCEQNGKWYLRGITSWGDGCGQPKKYGVYARVGSVQAWMNSVVAFPNKHRKAN